MSGTVTVMTTEELLALPDDGMERELIRGELRERPMTKRNRWHSRIEAKIVGLLTLWLVKQPEPRGVIYAGEAGCILRRDPDSTVGIDVAYVSAEMAAREPADTTLIDGPPVLAVAILSPTDKQEEINAKVDEYLATGVALVWVVDPHFRTVRVHRPGAEPELFNVRQELSADPHLPGFRVAVADIFA
jgi:Uma2 family endonuclease